MKKRVIYFLFCVAFAGTTAFGATYQRQEDGILIHLPDGRLRLQVCSQRIIRVQFTPGVDFPTRPSLMVIRNHWPTEWKVESDGKTVSILTSKLKVGVNSKTGALAFYEASGRVILQEPKDNGRVLEPTVVLGERVYHIRQNFQLTPDEAVYGLGQHQQGVMNYRDHDVTLVQENTVAVVPVLVSTNGWGILWDNYSRTKFQDGEDGLFCGAGRLLMCPGPRLPDRGAEGL